MKIQRNIDNNPQRTGDDGDTSAKCMDMNRHKQSLLLIAFWILIIALPQTSSSEEPGDKLTITAHVQRLVTKNVVTVSLINSDLNKMRVPTSYNVYLVSDNDKPEDLVQLYSVLTWHGSSDRDILMSTGDVAILRFDVSKNTHIPDGSRIIIELKTKQEKIYIGKAKLHSVALAIDESQ